jgi:hypothetical protein
MKIEYKRRAIYTVLAKVVNEQTLLDVMWHWQNTYSNNSLFELNKFLSDYKDIAEIANNRSLLYREMVALLVSEKKDILQDPWPLMVKHQRESNSSEPVKAEEKEDWSIVFTTVIDKLFYSLRSDTQKSMFNYMIQQLDKIELPILLKESFYLWIHKKSVIDTKGADLEQLKKLLNLVYIALCEFIGPVKSDLFLSNAIKETCSIHKDNKLDARLLL